MDGMNLHDATKISMQVVKKMIELNVDNIDKYKGIPLELCMEVLDE